MSSQSQTTTGNLQRSISTDSNQSPIKTTQSPKLTLLDSQTDETFDSSNDKDRTKCINISSNSSSSSLGFSNLNSNNVDDINNPFEIGEITNSGITYNESPDKIIVSQFAILHNNNHQESIYTNQFENFYSDPQQWASQETLQLNDIGWLNKDLSSINERINKTVKELNIIGDLVIDQRNDLQYIKNNNNDHERICYLEKALASIQKNNYLEIEEMNKKIITLENELSNFQQYNRRESIEISGLTDDIPQNDLERICIDILRRVGVYGLESYEIAACHRLKRKVGDEKHKELLFVSLIEKDHMNVWLVENILKIQYGNFRAYIFMKVSATSIKIYMINVYNLKQWE